MLTVSFKTSTLESIPRYAISEPISPLAGLTARARYDPSPRRAAPRRFSRIVLCSLPSLPPLVSFPCRYITAATSSSPVGISLAVFFQRSAHVTTLCSRVSVFSSVSATGIKRETNKGRVGKRGAGRRKMPEKDARGTGRGCWKIVTFRLISSNVPPLRRSLASSLSLLYTTCSCDHHPAVPSPCHPAHPS